jgi:hypothetical protein
MGSPDGRFTMSEKWPFHQLPPAGPGKCLKGEKNLGYNMTCHKRLPEKARDQICANVLI